MRKRGGGTTEAEMSVRNDVTTREDLPVAPSNRKAPKKTIPDACRKFPSWYILDRLVILCIMTRLEVPVWAPLSSLEGKMTTPDRTAATNMQSAGNSASASGRDFSSQSLDVNSTCCTIMSHLPTGNVMPACLSGMPT